MLPIGVEMDYYVGARREGIISTRPEGCPLSEVGYMAKTVRAGATQPGGSRSSGTVVHHNNLMGVIGHFR